MVYSFDVFDTLITRTTATPDGIFALMQKRIMAQDGLDDLLKTNFYELRIGAEQVARNTYCKNGIQEVTLEQIYDVLVKEHKITEEGAAFLQRTECDIESEYIVGISENISRVRDLLEKKERVILISDMYLDAGVIRQLLVKADPIFCHIPLYVSSDPEKKNKYSGDLFRIVKEKEDLRYDDWKHFGDNEHSDYEVPGALGIQCERYRPIALLGIETAYFKNGANDPEKQLMLGCTKIARLLKRENGPYALGCSIGGPILYPYVKWILDDCLKRGIKRLYFVARDGYVLKRVAEQLVEQKKLPIELYYVYGSRKAWRIPDKDDLPKEIEDIFEGSYKDRIFNAEDMAGFFQMPVERLKRFLPEKVLDEDLVWTMQTSTILLRYLLGSPHFLEELCGIYDKKRALLIEYLQQEIDVSDDRFAFVDLAGSGLTQDLLAKVMRAFYPKRIKNYFYRQDYIRNAVCDYHVFFPNHIQQYVLLEMLCRAPQEQTVGYERSTDGTVVPVFAHVDKAEIIRHQVPDFIDGAKRFAEIYDKVAGQAIGPYASVHCILPYLDYMHQTPDDMILDHFGDMPDMLTGREKKTTYYAPRLSDKDIKDIFWFREGESIAFYYPGVSFEYSLKRCTEKQKRKIERYKKLYPTSYGKLCRRIHRISHPAADIRTASIYDCIAQDIAVYGAGKVGQRFVRQITGREKVNGVSYSSNVVLWVDLDHQKYQEQGMPVSGPDDLDKKAYDQLIIAVAKKEMADSIKAFLLGVGVSENKILWIRE